MPGSWEGEGKVREGKAKEVVHFSSGATMEMRRATLETLLQDPWAAHAALCGGKNDRFAKGQPSGNVPLAVRRR
jgi:hypothetical protein